MPFPKLDDWGSVDEIVNAGTKGFNLLESVPRLLQENIPDLRKFKFHFCSKDDLPLMRSMRWVHLEAAMFDVDDWNQAIGTKHGLTEEMGKVKAGENYILIMPKQTYEELVNLRNRETEDALEATLTEKAGYAHPQDPKYAEAIEAAKELGSTEMATIYSKQMDSAAEYNPPTEVPEAGRRKGRGRPKRSTK